MASIHGGGGYTSRDGLSARPGNGPDQVQIRVDKFDFDAEVEGLRAHVGKIKDLARTIEDERKVHGEIINTLEGSMEQAKMALKRASKRLNIAYKQAQSNHLLFLVLFCIFIFFGVYFLARLYRMGRWIFGRH
mmetsp:Transcript_9665/g.23987  ORF Transcript_9665/g.23987 Transcript_9665/m.23987 type:complete len:133 (-) Transcript_9665:362-760(-)|eukprot:CAMPEP_0202857074 /NCGR_PEP_ID=MMETSP1391-20130828/153_1 /ASSEMBLY_ACC=CAM_ASM_000867 /TAXON_ID=1034604 /ORGANISM="Chlamydomonas leiostraca, Strain SAG 11-49" /LENGTH=132 /DNA_ID=CAMNT_0049535831 /DNA_START=178 /DNA_END=576 /DNA_ORIENTATION=+